MECNRDEAANAKQIAENKMIEKDIIGAKRFALKAQNLYPELHGLSQFLQVIALYEAAEVKDGGELNCYRILGANPFSDEEELKRLYKKMALAIHPDKNKSVGAEGAFKILSQAWDVLSDKQKRQAYDLRMNLRASSTNPLPVPTQPRTPTTMVYQRFSAAPFHLRNQAPASGSQYRPTPFYPRTLNLGTDFRIPNYQNVPLTAAWSQYYPDLNNPRNPPAGTSTQDIPLPPRPRNRVQFSQFQYTPGSDPRVSFDSHRAPQSTSAPPHFSAPPRPNAFDKSAAARNPTPAPSPSALRDETFWTVCNKCRIHFEYQKVFIGKTLQCPACWLPFMAIVVPTPTNGSRVAASPVMGDTLLGRHLQPSVDGLRRRLEDELNVPRDDEALPKVCTASEKAKAAMGNSADPTSKKGRHVAGGRRSGTKRKSVNLKGASGAEQAVPSGSKKTRSEKALSQVEIREMLMAKARTEIINILNEWKNSESTLVP